MRLHNPISSVLPQIGNTLVSNARSQAEKLGTENSEALHDFRVRVHYLQRFLKSYEDFIKGAKKHRQQFSDLMTLTNAGRHNEVHLAWLKARREKADDVEQEGIHYLLEHQSSNEDVKIEKVKKQFARAAKKLERTLSTKPRKTKDTFAKVTARVLQRYSQDLQKCLAKIEKSENTTTLHDACIAGEKLRYTLELLESEAKPLVKKLNDLQDLAGNLRDLYLLEPKVQISLFAEMKSWSKAFKDSYKTLGTTELSHLPELQRSYALAAVERTLEAEKTAFFQALQEQWLGSNNKTFFKELNALIKKLAKPEKPTKPPRKSPPKKVNARKTRKRANKKVNDPIVATEETATKSLTVN